MKQYTIEDLDKFDPEELVIGTLRVIIDELEIFDQERFFKRLTDHIKDVSFNGRAVIVDLQQEVYNNMLDEDADTIALVNQEYKRAKKDITKIFLNEVFDNFFSKTPPEAALKGLDNLISFYKQTYEERVNVVNDLIKYYAASKTVSLMEEQGLESCYETKKLLDPLITKDKEALYEEFVDGLEEYVDLMEIKYNFLIKDQDNLSVVPEEDKEGKIHYIPKEVIEAGFARLREDLDFLQKTYMKLKECSNYI